MRWTLRVSQLQLPYHLVGRLPFRPNLKSNLIVSTQEIMMSHRSRILAGRLTMVTQNIANEDREGKRSAPRFPTAMCSLRPWITVGIGHDLYRMQSASLLTPKSPARMPYPKNFGGPFAPFLSAFTKFVPRAASEICAVPAPTSRPRFGSVWRAPKPTRSRKRPSCWEASRQSFSSPVRFVYRDRTNLRGRAGPTADPLSMRQSAFAQSTRPQHAGGRQIRCACRPKTSHRKAALPVMHLRVPPHVLQISFVIPISPLR